MRTTRVIAGQFYADIVQDRRDPRLWIYVVQRVGSTDILDMGTCSDENDCRAVAQKALSDLSANDDGAAAAS